MPGISIDPLPADATDWPQGRRDHAKVQYTAQLQQLFAEIGGEQASPDQVRSARNGDQALRQLKDMDPVGLRDMNGRPAQLHPHRGGRRDLSHPGRLTHISDAWLPKIGAALDGTSGGSAVPPWFDSAIRDLPQRSAFVRSVIPSQPITSDKAQYLQQTVATQNAAAVAANAPKPKSVFTVAKLEAPVSVIAHISEAIDRSILSDLPQLSTFLDDQMMLGVLLAEESNILNGNGAPPNLRGILQTAGIQTQVKGVDPVPDAILKGMTKIRLVFAEPDAVVVHPNDWLDIRTLRTADGQYIWGEPAVDGVERIFGLEVIKSPVITEGTALVGAFGMHSQIWDREQANLRFTETGLGDNAGEELFSRNQIRFIAESRIAFAVTRPSAFCTITGI